MSVRRAERRRRPRFHPCFIVELGELEPLSRGGDEVSPHVEVSYDVEDVPVQVLLARAREEKPTDLRVLDLPLRLRDEGVRGLLDAVVQETVPEPGLLAAPIRRHHVAYQLAHSDRAAGRLCLG